MTVREAGAVPGGRVDRALLATAAAVVIIAGLRAAAGLVGPVLLALVIVVTVSPLSQSLQRRGWPRWLATTVLLLTLYGFLAGCSAIVAGSVGRLTILLPQYDTEAQDLLSTVHSALTTLGVTDQQARSVATDLDPGKLLDLAATVLGSFAGLLSDLVFVLALLFFMGIDAGSYPRRIDAVARVRPGFARALRAFALGTRRYLLVATVFGLVVAVFDGFALWALGIPLPVLWALLSFITNYIPNVGFVIGLAPPAVLALLEGGVGSMVLVVVVYSVINFVLQTLVQPKIVGDSVDLSVTVTFLSLVFWTWVIGGLGAILAIPLTLLVRALLIGATPQTRWASSLISAKPAPDDGQRLTAEGG